MSDREDLAGERNTTPGEIQNSSSGTMILAPITDFQTSNNKIPAIADSYKTSVHAF
jgi:hypothetical protein